MPPEERNLIDLQKLSQRELLRELYRKVIDMESDLKGYTEKYVKLLIKVSTLETRMAMWAAIAGIGASILVEFAIYLITK